jgi:methionyl aminopeptidase
MTADSAKDIEYLKAIGRVCAETLRKMMGGVRGGMTTRELDEIGRAFLEAEGARSAPQITYNFPNATCISVSPVIAHGIPNEHVLREGSHIITGRTRWLLCRYQRIVGVSNMIDTWRN